MSWLSDGKFYADEMSSDKPIYSGKDIPQLEKFYAQVNGA